MEIKFWLNVTFTYIGGPPPGMMQQGPGGQWIRHPQEVTLQQRGPMGGPMGGPGMPGPSGMGMRGPGPPQGMGQHPALMRQDSNSVPPPPPLNTKVKNYL